MKSSILTDLEQLRTLLGVCDLPTGVIRVAGLNEGTPNGSERESIWFMLFVAFSESGSANSCWYWDESEGSVSS
jgi:hypothetical protein